MGTIIDSLSVELGLDNTKFKKGIKESDKIQDDFNQKTFSLNKKQTELEKKQERERQKIHKEELHRNKETLEGFTKLRNEAISLLILFTAGKGILSFASSTFLLGTSMEQLSESTGIGVKELGGWQLAMQGVGGTAEEARAEIDKVSNAAASMKRFGPNESQINTMLAAGVAGVSTQGGFATGKSTLLMQAEIISALIRKTGPEDAKMWAMKMGVSPHMFELQKKGRSELERTIALEAQHAGWTARQAKESERALKMWNDIEAALESVGRTILFAINPAVSSAIAHLTKWVT